MAEAREEEPKLVPPRTPRCGRSPHPGPGITLPWTTPEAPPHRYTSAVGRLRTQGPRPVRVQLSCAPPVTPNPAIMRRKGATDAHDRKARGGRRGLQPYGTRPQVIATKIWGETPDFGGYNFDYAVLLDSQ